MRKKIVAGNWKMNMALAEGKQLVLDIITDMPRLKEHHEVIICPPFTHLLLTEEVIGDKSRIFLGAQNCHTEEKGAFTGEVSAAMIRSTGAEYVILGHSERREYFHETDEMLAKKVNTALANELRVIFCCGEPKEIREAGTQNDYVEKQVRAGLFHLSPKQVAGIVIAYEPIWAIGTGLTASSQQAQDMHAHIRSVLAEQYGTELADNTTILYGGSCKPDNARELFSCPDVDGGLIGGASLKAADFHGIIAAIAEQ